MSRDIDICLYEGFLRKTHELQASSPTPTVSSIGGGVGRGCGGVGEPMNNERCFCPSVRLVQVCAVHAPEAGGLCLEMHVIAARLAKNTSTSTDQK